ncbi:MAG TPA: methyl-accepting chemotaxis protein [Dissulfurispiraceae bacterium]|nr:methyl-accepting chemotaxis protein [Dissulfurispiraceae bacterium]
MIGIKNLRVKSQLILLCCVIFGGFIIFGLLAFYSINTIKVNGPIYKNIVQGKDLVADILPPPEYILESYLTIYQAADDPNPARQNALREKFKQLRKDFEEGHDHWQKDLPDGPMKDIIGKKSYTPAVAFYEKAEKELFPALASHDTGKVKIIMEELGKNYEIHRQAIDELVKLADSRNKADETSATGTIRNQALLLIVIMVITILVASVLAYIIARNLLYQIGGEPREIADVADRVAHGDLTVALESSGKVTGIYASMAAMVTGLKELVLNIKTNAQTIAAASEQLSASAEQMSRGVSDQSGRTSQIATSAEETS